VNLHLNRVLAGSVEQAIGTFCVLTKHSGYFFGNIKIITNIGEFIIKYQYKALFDILDYSLTSLVFPADVFTTKKITITNKLNHEL
jgi:hypothetical protein